MLTYKDLLLTGPEAVCMLGAELEVRQHNRLMSLLLGYRDKNLVGVSLSDILYDDTLIRHLLASDGKSDWFQGECVLRTNLNLPLIVKFRAGPVMDEEKKGYAMVFRETDEAQRLAYQRRLKSLRFLLDTVSKCDMEPEDMLLDFARMFDRRAEVMLLPPDSSEDKKFSLSQSASEAALKAMRRERAVLYSDEKLWCFFPVCSQNEVYGVACIKFAVQRLYSEEDKRIFSLAGKVLGTYMDTCTSRGGRSSSQSLLQTIFNGTDHPIVVVDRKGVITLCNAAAQTTYGYDASEIIGRSFGDLIFTTDGSARYEDLLNRVMRGDSIRDEEMTHLRSDWTILDVSVTAYPYTLDNGQIAGVVFILRDLREKKHLWNKMMQWEKLSVLGELLSNVANELNNPLAALTGYSQLLLHREKDEEIDSMMSTIYEEAKRCGNIVRSVLDLARGDEKYSHINDVIIAALDLKRRQLQTNNIDICMNLEEDIPGTVADPHDIERLFLRIINYAEQRMLEYNNGGQLVVESAFEDRNIVVRFADTGTCVLKDDIAEILDPFFTADGEDEGIGMGLSISCQILRNIGGNIRVDNQIGKGNVFTVELPAVKEMSSGLLEHTEEVVAGAPEAGKRVMVVDDEPAILDLLTELLQQMGHVTDVATDGNEAMNKLDRGDYDLVIVDLRMPCGLSGDRLHKFVKIKDPDLAERIIFITGDVANPETRKFLQNTSNPYLEKPFLLGALQETIQKSLSKRKVAE